MVSGTKTIHQLLRPSPPLWLPGPIPGQKFSILCLCFLSSTKQLSAQLNDSGEWGTEQTTFGRSKNINRQTTFGLVGWLDKIGVQKEKLSAVRIQVMKCMKSILHEYRI